MRSHEVEIVDATSNSVFERFLYSCLALPFRKYQRRREYLAAAVPRGLRKKLLLWRGEPVGTIEYAPPEAAGYPIVGKGIIVVNCIWVLRRAKGHGFGRLLIRAMMDECKDATGFATVGLRGCWSPWFKVEQLERLGFRSVDSVEVRHKTKHADSLFAICLMWLPRRENAKPPRWDKSKILEGVRWCMAHPLYHPQTYEPKKILRAAKRVGRPDKTHPA